MEGKRHTETFVASGRSLEDSFSMAQDRELLASRAKLTKMAETKEALADVSGIKDQAVLQKLVDINVRPETLAALSAIPLVGDDLLSTWQAYVVPLCERLTPADRDALKAELLRKAKAAASTSGGVLGIGKVSAKEKAILERLDKSFCA
jgi:hypothetical protein